MNNWSRLLNWKGLELSTNHSNHSNDSRKILTFLSINWTSLVGYWVVVQKIYSKMHPVSCTNTHHDATDLVISQERNIAFLWNKKIIDLCLRWHILRSYCVVAEVTLRWKMYLQNFGKFLLWMLDLLLKLFPLTSKWLQVATWVCMKSWLYSPLMSSSSPVHVLTIVLKFLWGWSYFTAEASTALNLA